VAESLLSKNLQLSVERARELENGKRAYRGGLEHSTCKRGIGPRFGAGYIL